MDTQQIYDRPHRETLLEHNNNPETIKRKKFSDLFLQNEGNTALSRDTLHSRNIINPTSIKNQEIDLLKETLRIRDLELNSLKEQLALNKPPTKDRLNKNNENTRNDYCQYNTRSIHPQSFPRPIQSSIIDTFSNSRPVQSSIIILILILLQLNLPPLPKLYLEKVIIQLYLLLLSRKLIYLCKIQSYHRYS